MPNWCHCTLIVSGDEEELKRFVEQAALTEEEVRKDCPEEEFASRTEMATEHLSYEEYVQTCVKLQPLSFARFVPEPSADELAKIGEQSEHFPGWYEWRLVHWGTKWDASFDGPAGAIVWEEGDVESSVESQGATIADQAAFYKFDTAWSPPVPFVINVSGQFPKLQFKLRFGEMGNGFAGEGIYRNGETIEETELDVEDVLAPEDRWF